MGKVAVALYNVFASWHGLFHALTNLFSQDDRMVENLDCIMSCMVITSPLQTGHPVVFATKGFAEMVGCHREALLGKSVFQVRQALRRLSTSTLLQLYLLCHDHSCCSLIYC